MKLIVLVTLALAASLGSAQFYGGYKDVPPPGSVRVATRSAGVEVRVDQKLNDFVPLDAQFKDEEGRDRKLRDFFRDKPVVMLPIFYKCPGICETELYSLVDSVKGFKRDFVGQTFDVVVFSIDPTEKSDLAAQKKDTVIGSYMGASTDRSKRVQAEAGWHFLTSDKATIDQVCDALGFRYTYDKKGGIVHPPGLMVLTPAGKISRYFVSTDYPQQLLLGAIRDADKNLIGAKDDRPFFLACVSIDPLTGNRTLNVLNAVKTGGVMTVIAILVSILVWNRKYRTNFGGNE